LNNVISSGKAVEKELIKKAKDGDKCALDKIISSNNGLVYSVLGRFRNRGVEFEDLYQTGVIGMIKAVKNFNLSLDVSFSTYAVHMIIGELKRTLRDGGQIKVSRSIQENASKLYRLRNELEKSGKTVTISELAEMAEIEMEDAVLAMDSMLPVLSLNEPINESEGAAEMGDMIGTDESEKMVDHISLGMALKSLAKNEKNVIIYRYYKSLTQMQTAEKMGISQVQVSRIERRAIEKLKGNLS